MAAHALESATEGSPLRTFFEAPQSQDEMDDVMAEHRGLP
jgi:hypothetical protein